MASEPDAISRPGLVLCEGPDDERLLRGLLAHLGIQTLWVEQVEGESQLRRYVRRLRIRTGFEYLRALAIVRDADTDADAKFSHSCHVLSDHRYPVPATPYSLASGSFPALESVGVGSDGWTGIMILPPSRPAGALEDLCLQVIADDPSLPCADDLMQCVESKGNVRWPVQYRSKARMNVWLASRSDPRQRLREAISAGLFPMNHQAFEPIRGFLTRLAAAASGPDAPPS